MNYLLIIMLYDYNMKLVKQMDQTHDIQKYVLEICLDFCRFSNFTDIDEYFISKEICQKLCPTMKTGIVFNLHAEKLNVFFSEESRFDEKRHELSHNKKQLPLPTKVSMKEDELKEIIELCILSEDIKEKAKTLYEKFAENNQNL